MANNNLKYVSVNKIVKRYILYKNIATIKADII